MAGRTADISTSSFKPLDLNEIMMVPLAKQKQEDQLSLAMDELRVLESNALDADREYVSKQRAALEEEVDSLSNQLTHSGVDKNLINKFKGLRRRKEKEFGLNGKTGQASAAYNQFQANKDAIMKRQDLSAAQKQLGLEEAKRRYSESGGASKGGIYEDYIGVSEIDLMDKGREIMRQMTPDQIRKSTGIFQDEHGLYRDGDYEKKELSFEDIQQVVYQSLKNDPKVQEYLAEVERLGIGNAETMLLDAAESSGNVGQKFQESDTGKILPEYLQSSSLTGGNVVDESAGSIGGYSQNWGTTTYLTGAMQYVESMKLNPDYVENHPESFSPLIEDEDGTIVSGGMLLDEYPKFEGDEFYTSNWNPVSGNRQKPIQTTEYTEYLKNKKIFNEYKEKIATARNNSPEAFNGKNDKEVSKVLSQAETDAKVAYATGTFPTNPNNTYYIDVSNNIIGDDAAGDMFAGGRGMKTMGTTGEDSILGPAAMAEKLGYDNIASMAKAFLGKDPNGLKAKPLGMSPADPDFPYGHIIQVPNKNTGGFTNLVVSANKNITQQYPQAGIMINNLSNAVPFQERVSSHVENGRSVGHYEYYINKISPVTGKYEPMLISSNRRFTKDDIDSLDFGTKPMKSRQVIGRDRLGNPMYKEMYSPTVGLNGEVIPNVRVQTYEQVMNAGTNRIQDLYDREGSTATTSSQAIKLK